ncbi:30S ribosomal protein S9 [Candidatus Similichlamydia laticola]|uniref:Small ribosomal subunit protein uS9 n=1 Tax=Candidatus Similichlamydia laticola TaxID=2170265 RepID=A0A369KG02_9BACT|nr:30S ribosomal protein S9 [Candidatus Similichlamydia laticola]RDB31635.1 SSU ribosomal protein S9p (S16e) [Candidatus Similichlamydia laticola]
MTIKESVATGRRKRAVASVRLRPGTGRVTINGKEGLGYFKTETQKNTLLSPLVLVKEQGSYDILVRVQGGGLFGQAGAIRLGLARALAIESEAFQPVLREAGLLTRDPRRRERKKYGRPGARKRFQFSKR